MVFTFLFFRRVFRSAWGYSDFQKNSFSRGKTYRRWWNRWSERGMSNPSRFIVWVLHIAQYRGECFWLVESFFNPITYSKLVFSFPNCFLVGGKTKILIGSSIRINSNSWLFVSSFTRVLRKFQVDSGSKWNCLVDII